MLDAGAVEISFADGGRPEDATRVRLDVFDGPIALLLALIEQRQLDVLTVRLGDLAGAYLDAIARIDAARLPLLSAFVSVCSQLIVIKSRAVLPRAPVAAANDHEGLEPDPEQELRRRLVEYRMYRDAGRALGQRLDVGVALFHREPGVAVAAAIAGARPEPAAPLDPRLLADALETAVVLVPPPPQAPEAIARTITLEERAAVIRSALRFAPRVVLQDLLQDVRDRIVIAVTFLAMLELAKAREVTIEQPEPWGPISLRPRAALPAGADAAASHAASEWT